MPPADELKATLLRSFEVLCEEIRRYPAPIARCDEQLAALLEQRAALRAQLAVLEPPAGGCSPINTWINDGGINGA